MRVVTPRNLVASLVLVAIGWLLHAPRNATAGEDAARAARAAADERAALLPLGFRTPPKSPLAEEGLRWLASVQDAQGGWSARIGGAGNPAYDVGVTALAVLAFLGAGYWPEGPEPYGQVVSRGLQRLLKAQKSDGCVGGVGPGNAFYNHAYGALAIVEAYALTGSEALYDPAERAVAFVRAARNPYFAWRYGVKPGDNDTSMTGAMCAVLAAARAVTRVATAKGLPAPFPSDQEEWEGAMMWLSKMTDPERGRVGYQRRGEPASRLAGTEDRFPASESECPTAIGLVIRLQQGERPDQTPIVLGQGLCAAHPPFWSTPAAIDLCYWYFASQAMFLLGGPSWEKWRAALHLALGTGAQPERDGTYWPAKDAWGSAGGAVYTTAMAVLCLETEQRCQWTPPDAKRLLDVAVDAKEALPFRVRALQLLAHRPRKAAGPALRPLLAKGPTELRIAAAAAVGGLGAEGCPLLEPLVLRDPDEHIRTACVRALGASGAKPAAEPLRLVLRKDASAAVRAAAARALGELPEAMAESTPALEAATTDPDAGVVTAARETLDRSRAPRPGPGPVPPHEPGAHAPPPPALDDLDSLATALASEIRWAEAAAGLAKQGAAALPTLRALLKDPRATVRARVLPILVRLLGPDTEEGLSLLLSGASDPELAVREAAMRSLATVTQPTPAVRAAVRAGLADPEPSVAEEAVDVLRAAKLNGPEEAQALGTVLSRDPETLAVSAARLLGHWALGERSSTDALIERLTDRRTEVRAECVYALAAVAGKDSRAFDHLAPILGWPNDAAFHTVWHLFGKLGSKAARLMAKRIADEDRTVRGRAGLYLERLGPKALDAVPDILESLARPDATTYDTLLYVRIFEAMGKPGIDALLPALKDPRAELRANAAKVLGELGAKARAALGPLGRAKTYERSEDVRKAIDFAIYQIQRALK